MLLNNPQHIKSEDNRRSFTDERRKVDYHVWEYVGSDGERYRKGFETVRGFAPDVPTRGTHAQINAAKIQWRDSD